MYSRKKKCKMGHEDIIRCKSRNLFFIHNIIFNDKPDSVITTINE